MDWQFHIPLSGCGGTLGLLRALLVVSSGSTLACIDGSKAE